MRRILASPPAVYLALASVFVGAYVGLSAAAGYVGYPLDDAWIHQTYARNLGQRLEFAFVPGQPSAGSTSPLWTTLIALGYALRVEHHLWTYGLGILLLGLNAWLAHRLVARLAPGRAAAAWTAGLLAVAEWHLVWAGASGMETLAFSAAVLLVFTLDAARAAWMGVLTGLALFVRPDALSLLPFVLLRAGLGRLVSPKSTQRLTKGSARPSRTPALAIRPMLAAGLGFVLMFAGYLAFNQAIGGTPWPNTLYAKQAEYAILRELPFAARLAQVGILPFIGPAALLAPGLGVCLYAGLRAPSRWMDLLPLGWAIAFALAYVLRLPVTYQHGRYLIPVIPICIALGVGGLWPSLKVNAPRMLGRVLSRAWLLSLLLITAAFWVLGAQAYARDVRIIETEMVQTARWLARNTEPDARIAAHDIGAVGYYANRTLLDLAGLVSPEVIPFIRDEVRLAKWLNQERTDYLVTFPDWYPALVNSPAAEEIYSTGSPFSPAEGGENMSVYRWRSVFP